MDFMSGALKSLEKSGISVGNSGPPTYWISTGNYAQNKIISGSFKRGIAQGRLAIWAGPAGSGKSFNVANVMREAQAMGAHVVTIDSEGALDDEFVGKLGVDTENNYSYISAITIDQCKKTVSTIIQGYKSEYDDSEDAPKMLICIDSLSFLLTANELDSFEKGLNKGDQGQRNKQLKAMLTTFQAAIRSTNISIVCTAQVYKSQDMYAEFPLVISDSIIYAASQLVLVTKLKLKDTETKDVIGIRMKVLGFKTRFTKPFQSQTIYVPYEDGMDPYSGLLEIAESMGVVTKSGAWMTVKSTGEKFQKKTFDNVKELVLEECEKIAESHFIEAVLDDDTVEDTGDNKISLKQQRTERLEQQFLTE